MPEIGITHKNRVLYFRVRDEGTDRAVINEAFGENTYNIHEDDFNHTGVFVDIGANIGAVSLLARGLGAKTIVAYEPDPENFAALNFHMSVNSVRNYTLSQDALWSSEKTLRMTPLQGDSKIVTNPHLVEEYADKTLTSVHAISLRQALEQIPEVDVLKCDTEGAEYEIFHDKETNSKIRKIVLEFHNATEEQFGKLVATLVLTHHVSVFGKWNQGGGQLTALRY